MDYLTHRKIINFMFNSWSIYIRKRTCNREQFISHRNARSSGICNSVMFRRSIQIRLLTDLTEGLAAALDPDVLDADVILVGRRRDVVDIYGIFVTVFGLDR